MEEDGGEDDEADVESPEKTVKVEDYQSEQSPRWNDDNKPQSADEIIISDVDDKTEEAELEEHMQSTFK